MYINAPKSPFDSLHRDYERYEQDRGYGRTLNESGLENHSQERSHCLRRTASGW